MQREQWSDEGDDGVEDESVREEQNQLAVSSMQSVVCSPRSDDGGVI